MEVIRKLFVLFQLAQIPAVVEIMAVHICHL